MPDGRPTKKKKYRRSQRRLKLLTVYVLPTMKRDLKRMAAQERLPLSRFCAGIIRLGMGRYFELLDERRARPLLEKMRDIFSQDAPFPEMPQLVKDCYEATRS